MDEELSMTDRWYLLNCCHQEGYFPTACQVGALEVILENHPDTESAYAATREIILEWRERFPDRAFDVSHGLV